MTMKHSDGIFLTYYSHTIDCFYPYAIDILCEPSVYGHFHFRLWNPDTEKTSANTELSVDGHPAKSNDDGFVTLTSPLAPC